MKIFRRMTAAFAILFLTSIVSAQTPTPKPPNIIFILADDLGYGDLGCYGQQQILTPHIDKIATEGMRFTDCYAGSTVCAPSRCCLMTGKHTGHSTIRGNVVGVSLTANEITVAQIAKQAGYATALFGKWGCGDEGSPGIPNRKGFDEFFGYLNQVHAHNYYPTFLWRNEKRVLLRNVVPQEKPTGAGVASTKLEYSNDLFADEAIKFLAEHKSVPSFLYLPFTIPHANNEGKQNGMEVPNLVPYTTKDWPVNEKRYAAMVTRLDRYVGDIMDQLVKLNLDDNTLVFFTSDNGPHHEGGHDPDFFHSSGPLRGIKRSLYDGGIRIPMIARWPGHIEKGVNSQPIAFWDLLPTVADLTHQKPPDGIDGISLMPDLLGLKQERVDRALYWEFKEGKIDNQAMRWQQWKYVRPEPGAAWELYDVSNDIGETKNVAAGNPKVVESLNTRLKTIRTEP